MRKKAFVTATLFIQPSLEDCSRGLAPHPPPQKDRDLHFPTQVFPPTETWEKSEQIQFPHMKFWFPPTVFFFGGEGTISTSLECLLSLTAQTNLICTTVSRDVSSVEHDAQRSPTTDATTPKHFPGSVRTRKCQV